jgi:hypothetical protein
MDLDDTAYHRPLRLNLARLTCPLGIPPPAPSIRTRFYGLATRGPSLKLPEIINKAACATRKVERAPPYCRQL